MGIDVLGRGTFGGGGWNTNVALDVLKRDDVSAAIFAPGWVHEHEQETDFQTAQNKWWGSCEAVMRNSPKLTKTTTIRAMRHAPREIDHAAKRGSRHIEQEVEWNPMSRHANT
ncbi:cytosolic endo-beta-N-acetylglucosaminidase 1-like [Cucumis melo]|uniref:Cytosolic endo-beta-N-acetylglucosaminidase 1-like n=1 Tax=Cucumis melo TaxID=3656 RepID=A0ABM3L9T0_CUCME|nr:cytosolic endo-beta-N-acetylglucosaminidase 1-like [Cucumis melo]